MHQAIRIRQTKIQKIRTQATSLNRDRDILNGDGDIFKYDVTPKS